MSEITDLHQPFAAELRKRKLCFINSRSDVESTIAEGAQDFTVLHANRCLCIEFKQPKTGKLSTKQEEWISDMARTGTVVHVVRDIQTAIALLDAWLSMMPVAKPLPDPGNLVIRKNGSAGDYVFKGLDCIRRATLDDVAMYPRK